MSSPPNSRLVSSNARSTAWRPRTSAGVASARPPAFTISSAVTRISAAVRATQPTAAPWPPYASAIALPIPRPAPVTTATFPSSRPLTVLPFPHRCGGHGELVGVDGDLHDRGLAGGERGADDVADLIGV